MRNDAAVLSYVDVCKRAASVFSDREIISEEPASRRLGTTPRKSRACRLSIWLEHIALDQKDIQVAIVIEIE